MGADNNAELMEPQCRETRTINGGRNPLES
jgi:hypothetical protein